MTENIVSINTKIQFGILHNRKTAGTALKHIIDQHKLIKPLPYVACFSHAMTYPRFIEQYPNAQAIFFIRDPISRFVSGFNSRLRKGLPRYYFQWSSAETRAFTRFHTANQLAESLSSMNWLKRRQAVNAMLSIGHVKHTYTQFLGSLDFLRCYASRIAYIGSQPEFDADIARLRQILNLDDQITPPTNIIDMHANPVNVDTHLSAKAIANLKKWYKQDYRIYDWCMQLRERILAGEPVVNQTNQDITASPLSSWLRFGYRI